MFLILRNILLIVLVFGVISYQLWPAVFHELKLNVSKYTYLNIPQNTGVHQQALRIIKILNTFFPYTDYIEYEHKKGTVGIDKYDQKRLYENAFVTTRELVTNVNEIVEALKTSQPGTSILIAPGVYRFEQPYIIVSAKGTLTEPILLHANKLGDVIFEMKSREGLLIKGGHWRIQNIIFRGAKDKNDSVDHAIHIIGDANNIHVLHNEFVNFNAHIKSNGYADKVGNSHFPDNVLIANNNFYNEWKRNTVVPVTPIDVVGGNNWTIENNFIADFANFGRKGRAVVYGAFMKGGGENGLFNNNVVNCSWRVPYTSAVDVRIGLSFGGGGTGKSFCQSEECIYEHKHGEMKNNTILNCSNDVSVYINKGQDISVHSNVMRNSLGIDVRFEGSRARVFNNYLDGRIKARDGAQIHYYDNTFLN
jgi:pectate lyase